MRLRADAVLFDKDGTLFDFAATWNGWGADMISALAGNDADLALRLAFETRFDLVSGEFLPDSPAIAGTHAETLACFARAMPHRSVDDIEAFLLGEAAEAPLVEPVPLVPLLAELAAYDLSLGVMTNDAEAMARAHLRRAGVERMFDFIAGFDSGFGAKPSADPLIAGAKAMGHRPERVVMVGDSVHDLKAGRAAGMATVGVLTGPTPARDLVPWADAVLPNIGALPEWLQGRS